MKIVEILNEPVGEIYFRFAGPRGRTETGRLEICTATVDGLPEELDALLVASDLQGVAPSYRAAGANALLGVVLAEQLVQLADAELVPEPSRIGVILAGDLFSESEGRKRGATGDVTPVWRAFAEDFAWVAGVAGNHDLLSTTSKRISDNVHFLDGETVELGGLSVGGVSLISGNPNKQGRRSIESQLELIGRVLDAEPNIVVLHEGPNGSGRKQKGDPNIRAALEDRFDGLVICGHVHWRQPLSEHESWQTLNVDDRAILMQR